jgi:NifQ
VAWHAGLFNGDLAELEQRLPQACTAWREAAGRPMPVLEFAGPELLDPLRELLMTHRASGNPALTVLGNAIASACFGEHHLWQDLGLERRQDVSGLLEIGFPALYQSNVRNLRWKRHLFDMLSQRLGRAGLRPPRCEACEDYELCFGSVPPVASKSWPLNPSN